MASPILYNPDPVGQSKNSGDARVPEATHGGFRNNIHLNAHEAMADETGMGRDTLRSTDTLSESDVLRDQCFDDVKNAWGARGSKQNYTTSPWTKLGLTGGANKEGE